MISRCEQVPVVRLGLVFTASRNTYLPPNVAAKFRGAMKQRLELLARSGDDPHRRAALRHARKTTESMQRTSASGLDYVPFALDVPWTTAPIGPETPFACELLLLEDAAQLWPAWVEALQEFRLGDLPVRLEHACVLEPGLSIDLEDAWEDPWGVQRPLRDHLPECDSECSAVRIHLLTPTCWNRPENLDPSAQLTVRHFIISIFRRLSLLADRSPSESECRQRDRDLPCAVRIAADRSLVVVRTSRPSPSRKRASGAAAGTPAEAERMEYGGMMGHFDLEGVRGQTIPPVLMRALRIVEVTHLGAHVAFGCGRIALELLR
ncbi:MAG: CRISPR system precrRNA processing endoribonuclease RAMP protein Cas6 [Armatimonadetes bacterium]|nr:CRISPR system precrRNA processing endoribonuclease RAMP protein Cas6 [Armatimonadota bacterium]